MYSSIDAVGYPQYSCSRAHSMLMASSYSHFCPFFFFFFGSVFFAIVCVLTSQWRHSHQVTGLVFSCYFVSIMIRIVHFSSWVFCSHNEFSYVLCCTLSPYTYIWFVNGITYSLHSACSSVLFSSPRLENDFVSIFSKGVNNSFFPTFQNEVEKLIPYLNLAKLLILVME